MSNNRVRVCVIGTGGMGGRHAENLAHRVVAADLVAIMEVNRARAEAVADACGGAAVFTDAQALIDDPLVDAVVVATPDATHAALTLACIAAGKPVLCEKPLGISLDEARRVVAAENATGRRLVQVGLMRVFDPPHVALKQLILDGEIGRPLLFRGIHRNLGRPGIDVAADPIVNAAVHDIHSARWIMGDDVTTVYVSRVVAEADRPESCRLMLLQLTFRGGGLASILVDADSGYGYEVAVEVSGEHGTAATPSLSSPVVRKAGGAGRAVEADWLARFKTAYELEDAAWVRSILDAAPTGPTAWDGYAAMRVSDAGVRSLQSGAAETLAEETPPPLYGAR